jgi:hypothetical protein
MWKERTKIILVITGALETIKEGLDENLQLLSGHLSVTEPQKITLMSTAHILTVKGYLLLRSGLSRRPPPGN